jgi:hypothetical protein
MINSNLLADRLNAYRNNEELPQPEKPDEYEYLGQENFSLLTTFLLQFFNLILVFAKSLGYGYAAKTIFATDWNFLAFLSVGFAFELILTSILNTFTKDN